MSEQLEPTKERFDPVEWITTAEAAELTGYTIFNLHRARESGSLTAIKRGNMLFFKRDDVLDYAEQMRRLGNAKFTPKSHRVTN